MALRHTLLIAPLLLVIGACETAQENPNYKYSSTYGEQAPQVFAQNSRHPDQVQAAPVRYVQSVPSQTQPITQASAVTAYSPDNSTGTYTRVNHECLDKERNRTLIGAGLGGSAGALAGNKLIGGTKGTLIGAAAGGVAGYGLGDASINCDPVEVHTQGAAPVIASAYNTPNATTHLAASETASSQTYEQSSTEAIYTASPTETIYNSETVGTPGYEAIQQSQTLSADVSATAPNAYPAPVQSYTPPAYETYAAAEPIVPANALGTQNIWSEGYNNVGGNYTVQAGDTIYSLSRNLCTTVGELKTLNSLDNKFSINVGQTLQLPTSKC